MRNPRKDIRHPRDSEQDSHQTSLYTGKENVVRKISLYYNSMESVHYIDQETNENETRLEILKTQVQNLPPDDVIKYINQLEQTWRLDCRGDPLVPLTNGFRQFYQPAELGEHDLPREVDTERLAEQHKRKQRVLGELFHRAVALGIFDDESEDINGNNFKISMRNKF